LYKLAKWFERRFLLNADHIVSLTNVAVGQIHDLIHHAGKLPTITVIPTCTDLDRFRPHGDGKSGFVLGYVGSASTWHNFDAVAHCFSLLREFKPEATLMILNRGEHEYIEARLRSWDIPREAIELHTVRHDDVPAYISRMHAGIFFYKTCFSRLACAPTKLGEFLGCGVPCIGNRGVGDIADIIENEKVGIVVPGFETGSLTEGLGRLLTLLQDKDLEERCVATAWKYFSLGEGVERYKRIYSEMSDLQ
jgi:glycosyltransferase involved in cell wall biosynthesis